MTDYPQAGQKLWYNSGLWNIECICLIPNILNTHSGRPSAFCSTERDGDQIIPLEYLSSEPWPDLPFWSLSIST